jgi:hypothetical protein
MGARNDEIRDKIIRSRWLAVLLFSLAWTQPVNAQENIRGAGISQRIERSSRASLSLKASMADWQLLRDQTKS